MQTCVLVLANCNQSILDATHTSVMGQTDQLNDGILMDPSSPHSTPPPTLHASFTPPTSPCLIIVPPIKSLPPQHQEHHNEVSTFSQNDIRRRLRPRAPKRKKSLQKNETTSNPQTDHFPLHTITDHSSFPLNSKCITTCKSPANNVVPNAPINHFSFILHRLVQIQLLAGHR